MSKRIAIFFNFVLIFFLLISTKTTFANRHGEVLGVGDAVKTALEIPPTTEGPGLILPDSPLFFLDRIKQDFRLFFAFTPEAKARAYKAVSGERLAELRFILAKNNLSAAKVALDGISDNLNRAASEVSRAKLTGRNVSDLAKTINDDIKQKQQTLDALEIQAKGELKLRANVVLTSLLKSKIEIEDALSQKDLENEISDDLNRKIAEKVKNAAASSTETQMMLEELEKEASNAATASLSNRQSALQKAILEKNEILKKVEEKLLQKEKEKQLKLLEVQSKVAEQAKEAVAKAREAALKFQQFQQAANSIRNRVVTTDDVVSVSPSAKPTPAASNAAAAASIKSSSATNK